MKDKVNCKDIQMDSSSLSLLDLKWGSISDNEIQGLIYPNSFDPLFSNMFIEVGPLLHHLLKKIQSINFIYRPIEDNFFRICNLLTREVMLKLRIYDFTKVSYCLDEEIDIFMILNKQLFRKSYYSKINKTYKKDVKKRSQIDKNENEYEKMMSDLYALQIERKINFIFIDSVEELQREIKSLVKSINLNKEYVPKIKSFRTENKDDHFEYILSKIPGISSCVAKNIANKYKSFSSMYKILLENDGKELEKLLIWDDENKKCRPLGRKQLECILKVFLSEDRNEFLS